MVWTKGRGYHIALRVNPPSLPKGQLEHILALENRFQGQVYIYSLRQRVLRV